MKKTSLDDERHLIAIIDRRTRKSAKVFLLRDAYGRAQRERSRVELLPIIYRFIGKILLPFYQ
jgi:hypothetical protein